MKSNLVLRNILKTLSSLPLSFLLPFLFLCNTALNAQWVPSNGPAGGYVNCIAATGDTIIAGTNDGVYISTSNGINWTKPNNILYDSDIYSMTAYNNNIFTGADSGIFLSTNNGVTWTQISSLQR